METAFVIGWWIWAPLCALLSRTIVVRLLHSRLGKAAFAAAYAFWIVSFIAGFIFVQWSGLDFYSFDRTDPWQIAGWIVLFVSPFGLPLLFGGPIVFLADMVRFAIINRRKGALLAG